MSEQEFDEANLMEKARQKWYRDVLDHQAEQDGEQGKMDANDREAFKQREDRIHNAFSPLSYGLTPDEIGLTAEEVIDVQKAVITMQGALDLYYRELGVVRKDEPLENLDQRLNTLEDKVYAHLEPQVGLLDLQHDEKE